MAEAEDRVKMRMEDVEVDASVHRTPGIVHLTVQSPEHRVIVRVQLAIEEADRLSQMLARPKGGGQ